MKNILAFIGLTIALTANAAVNTVSTSWTWKDGTIQVNTQAITYSKSERLATAYSVDTDNPGVFGVDLPEGYEVTKWCWCTKSEYDSGFSSYMSGGYPHAKETNAETFTYPLKSDGYLGVFLNEYEYTVTFDKNAVSAVGTMANQSSKYFTSLTLNRNSFTRTGYSFVGWAKSPTGAKVFSDKQALASGQPLGVQSDAKTATLYAVWKAKTVTLALDAQGGTVLPTTMSLTYDNDYVLPDATKEGHTFVGWYNDPVAGEKVAKEGKSTYVKDQTLYARYSVNSYFVEVLRDPLSEGSGTVSNGGSFPYGTTLTIQATPADGSHFAHWNDGNIEDTRNVTVTNSVKYLATFDLNEYAVSFIYMNPQGRQVTDTQTVKYGKAATPPADSVVDQYPKHHFTGWGNNSYGTVRGNLEVQALYEWNGYNIRYNVNAPSGEGWGSMSVQNLKMDAPHPLSRNNFSRTGHTFLGWSRDKSATTPAYHDEESVDALTDVRDAIVDLYAVWQPNTYTITFNANGEDATVTPETKTVTYGQTYGDLPTPERPANSFRGWYTTRSGADKVEPTTTVTITANQTLYAQWTSLRKTITYNLDGGRNPDGAPTSYIEGEGVTLPIPTRTGYVFKGWYTDEALASEVQTAIDSEAKGEKTFYARWRVKYTVLRLNANGGELAAEDAVRILEYGKKYQDISNIYPTHRDDFADLYLISVNDGVFTTDELGRGATVYYAVKALDFLPPNATFTYKVTVRSAGTGSYSNWEDGDGQLGGEADGTGSFDVLPGQNLTIYSKGNVLTPEYALDGSLTAGRNGLSGFSFSVELSCGTNNVGVAALPTPTREGWAFAGWYTEAEGGTRITDTTTVGADPATTLYAHWRSTTYKVTFDPQRGTVDPTSKSVILDQSYGDLPEPTREGYDFVGWYISSASGEKVEPTTVVTREYDHTLYAHWTPKTYAITYSVTNGVMKVAPVTGTFDESVSFSWSPDEQAGYEFPFKEAVVYAGTDRTGEVLANMTSGSTGYFTMTKTYHAAVFVDVIFEKKGREYWVSFDGNGGTPSSGSIKVTYDGTYPDLPTASRDGSTFGGWWTDATAGTQVQKGDKVTITEDQRLYAHWTQDQYTIAYYGGASATGTMADQKANVNAEVQLQPNAFERTGYTFLGWATDEAAAESWKWTYADEATLPARFAKKDTKVSLYATWTNNTYTVRYDPNGGVGKMQDQKLTYDASAVALTSNRFVRASYTFTGWSLTASGSVAYQDGQKVQNLTADANGIVILYAQWDREYNALAHAADCDQDKGSCKFVDLKKDGDPGEYDIEPFDMPDMGGNGKCVALSVRRGDQVHRARACLQANVSEAGKLSFYYKMNLGPGEHETSALDPCIFSFEVNDEQIFMQCCSVSEWKYFEWDIEPREGSDSAMIKWVAEFFNEGGYDDDDVLYIDCVRWQPKSENPVPTEADRPVIGAGFTFMTDARFDYVVWTTESLEAPIEWTLGEAIKGDGKAFTLPVREDADGTVPQRFYKVEVRQRQN